MTTKVFRLGNVCVYMGKNPKYYHKQCRIVDLYEYEGSPFADSMIYVEFIESNERVCVTTEYLELKIDFFGIKKRRHQ